MTESSDYYEYLHKILPRYLRIRDRELFERSVSSMLDNSLRESCRINWMGDFICLPGTSAISNINPGQFGCYPMDIASAQAVKVMFDDLDCRGELEVKYLRVLDLCCCPGSKYQMIADILSGIAPLSTVVGVDISKHRMQTCKKLVSTSRQSQSSNFSSVRQLLFLCDGTQFGALDLPESGTSKLIVGELVFDSQIVDRERAHLESQAQDLKRTIRRRMNKSARSREQLELTKSLRCLLDSPETPGSPILTEYDYVLVDAECSHDGSYRHMRYVGLPSDVEVRDSDVVDSKEESEHFGVVKRRRAEEGDVIPTDDVPKIGNGDSEGTGAGAGAGAGAYTGHQSLLRKQTASIQYHNPERPQILQSLQRSLLQNGFKLLRRGGTLVYSTCSLEDAQNEDIVRWFLETEPTSILVPCINSGDCKGDDQLSMGASDLSPSTPDLLQLPPSEFVAYMKDQSDVRIASIGVEVCQYVAGLETPPLVSGKIPGTLRLTKNSAMSGLFIAKFTKR